MGKYMKKAKPKGELAPVESTTNTNTNSNTNTTTSYMGVRTRAKTLALQKSHPQPEHPPAPDSYLQLRSRRLRKPPISLHSPKRSRHPNPKSPIPEPPRLGLASDQDNNALHDNNADPLEPSFGENVLDFEGRERTPGSTTRPTCSTEVYQRTENAARRQIPTSREMDEFFAEIEESQQRQFIEKYNFDPVNEKPLPGRYEWEKLKP
ncbi:hypothetical protein Fmac_024110 [Flemingia macrophylla]|uniref:Cyclin-dependent kinase inhibitor n=1 Tax=Flemingia macrophylla TaxID=520843 RepID=A0ABD1LNH5_9FABA